MHDGSWNFLYKCKHYHLNAAVDPCGEGGIITISVATGVASGVATGVVTGVATGLTSARTATRAIVLGTVRHSCYCSGSRYGVLCTQTPQQIMDDQPTSVCALCSSPMPRSSQCTKCNAEVVRLPATKKTKTYTAV